VRSQLEHPVDRGEPLRRSSFDNAAQLASYLTSSPLFFLMCSTLVLAWAVGYALGASSAYEQATGTALTAVTLLLVALLKNAELRAEAAMQRKLDALATAMLESIRHEGREADTVLADAIGLEEQL